MYDEFNLLKDAVQEAQSLGDKERENLEKEINFCEQRIENLTLQEQ